MKNCENPSICLSESRLWSLKLFLKRESTLEKIDKWEQRKARTEILCSFRSIFRISKCFRRSKQKLYIYFSLEHRTRQDFKTICACTESTLVGLLKKYLSGDRIPLNWLLSRVRYWPVPDACRISYLRISQNCYEKVWNRYQSLGSRNCLLKPRKSPQPGPSFCRQLTNTA